ncbi:MAG: ABC transporter permease [Rhizobium sp. 63-7]|nr:MAG: ABC transporter permease [Rhizobium sp. 63-7]
MTFRPDKLGVVIAALALCGVLLAPFSLFRANRIVQGEAKSLLDSLPAWAGLLLLAAIVATSLVALTRSPAVVRLAAAAVCLVALLLGIGLAALHLTPPDNTYARISPASGFWLLCFAFALLAADAITRLKPKPLARILFLAAALLVIAFVLLSGSWDGLSLLKEYANRAETFWLEARRHVMLALGSLFAAVVAGLPLGILCHRTPSLRGAVLNSLNIVQTIPSIALFGILIAPLGWIALNVPGAAAIGIRGIGMAPAFVALFLYSLLPVVANTVVGLGGVPRDVNEAARGLGMTDSQRLWRVEFPLALPVILTGVRIVLVQNIGLATIAALIGGGGFGVFVFQGIGQTAMDLVLLGAAPTVLLAFVAAIVLDALIDMNAQASNRKTTA